VDAARRRHRILLVGNDAEVFVRHRLALAIALCSDDIELHVAVPFSKQDPRFAGHPFQLHPISLRRGSTNPFSEAQVMLELAAVLRRVRPDLVHFIAIKPVLYGAPVARLLRTPHIVNTITGLGYIFASRNRGARLLRALVNPIMRFGCYRPNVTMLFENEDDRDVFCASRITTSQWCRIIPSSGIDCELFTPRDHRPGPVTVMLLSRMLWDKGVGEFVEAARQVRRTHPATRFLLVGATDTNPESIPEATLQQWHANGDVEYVGWQTDIPAVLRAADILCLPSYREGLSRSLLEGAAAGLPLITTDVPGCRDAIRDGVTGLLVPPRDAPSLAQAIIRLVDDASLRASMGAAARADAEARFSVASVAARTRAIYLQLLDGTKSGTRS
jgi:glycosyltransferase involved in cell wall biosynthesis